MKLLGVTLFWAIAAGHGACASPTAAHLAPGCKAIVVSGANKGLGLGVCERLLRDCDDTIVFLGSRDSERGQAAVAGLSAIAPGRVELVLLDVTDDASVRAAASHVADRLGPDGKLYGLVSNAGILWGHTLAEQAEVNTLGMHRFIEAFLPLVNPDGGRVVSVSSGMGPLMHSYASPERRAALMAPRLSWEAVQGMLDECLAAESGGRGPQGFEAIGFGFNAFAEVPYFPTYGLTKMLSDSWVRSVATAHPKMHINSVDPGLTYSDQIKVIPTHAGKTLEETGARTPTEAAEVVMRLLFGTESHGVVPGGGHIYTVSKDPSKGVDGLLSAPIDTLPEKPF